MHACNGHLVKKGASVAVQQFAYTGQMCEGGALHVWSVGVVCSVGVLLDTLGGEGRGGALGVAGGRGGREE